MKDIFSLAALTFSCVTTSSFALNAVCNENTNDRTAQVVHVTVSEPYMTHVVVTYPNPGYQPFSFTLPCFQNFDTNALTCMILEDGLPTFKFTLSNEEIKYETHWRQGFGIVLSSYYTCKKVEEYVM